MAHDGLVLSADKKVIKLWDHEKVSAVTIPLGYMLKLRFKGYGELCVDYPRQ